MPSTIVAKHIKSRTDACKLFPELLQENSRYFLGEVIGKGAYSIVCSALEKLSGPEVAIKKIFDWTANPTETRRTIREIDIMRHFDSVPQIISVKDVILPETSRGDLLVVTEKMDYDLHHFITISGHVKRAIRKNILLNIVSGLNTLHKANVVHRDLKPKNILMKGERVVIADMGMSRDVLKTRRMSLLEYTTCPPYCPPEGILKCPEYGTKADIWALGCIWLEMILGLSYFKKASPLDDPLHKIFAICNATYSNSKHAIQTLTEGNETQRSRAKKIIQQQSSHPDLQSLLKGSDVSAGEIRLLQRIFQLDPAGRITAEELMCSELFKTKESATGSCRVGKYVPPETLDQSCINFN